MTKGSLPRRRPPPRGVVAVRPFLGVGDGAGALNAGHRRSARSVRALPRQMREPGQAARTAAFAAASRRTAARGPAAGEPGTARSGASSGPRRAPRQLARASGTGPAGTPRPGLIETPETWSVETPGARSAGASRPKWGAAGLPEPVGMSRHTAATAWSRALAATRRALRTGTQTRRPPAGQARKPQARHPPAVRGRRLRERPPRQVPWGPARTSPLPRASRAALALPGPPGPRVPWAHHQPQEPERPTHPGPRMLAQPAQSKPRGPRAVQVWALQVGRAPRARAPQPARAPHTARAPSAARGHQTQRASRTARRTSPPARRPAGRPD